MRPAIIIQKRIFLPRKGIREKEKAARLASITVTRLITIEVSSLLKYQRARLLVASVVAKACKVKCEAVQETGIAVVSPSGLSAVSSAHNTGINQSIASMISIASAIPLVTFLFIEADLACARSCGRTAWATVCVDIRHPSPGV